MYDSICDFGLMYLFLHFDVSSGLFFLLFVCCCCCLGVRFLVRNRCKTRLCRPRCCARPAALTPSSSTAAMAICCRSSCRHSPTAGATSAWAKLHCFSCGCFLPLPYQGDTLLAPWFRELVLVARPCMQACCSCELLALPFLFVVGSCFSHCRRDEFVEVFNCFNCFLRYFSFYSTKSPSCCS